MRRLTVYQCSDCEKYAKDRACGFNGECLDWSNDECHHPLYLDEARRMAAAWNFTRLMPVEKFEGLVMRLRKRGSQKGKQ